MTRGAPWTTLPQANFVSELRTPSRRKWAVPLDDCARKRRRLVKSDAASAQDPYQEGVSVPAKRLRIDCERTGIESTSVKRINLSRSSKKQANLHLFGGQAGPDPVLDDILDHIGGFLVRHCPAVAECPQCTAMLVDLPQGGSRVHHWINRQERHPGRMTRSTAPLVNLLLSAEKYFAKSIPAVAHLPDLRQRLLRACKYEPLLASTCEHQLTDQMSKIFFQTRLKCWCFRLNEEVKDSRRQKSFDKLRKLGVAVRCK